MGKPLDNPASVAVRNVVDTSTVRSEPVVEFARKKSPLHATESFDDVPPLNGHSVVEREFRPLRIVDLAMVPMPRDNNKPLVTAKERYAKEALESYKSLRTRLLRSQLSQGFSSVAITSVGKSDGKTLTSFNLACCCAQVEDCSVLLIDADLSGRSLTKLIGRLPSIGLGDVMSGAAACDEAIVKTDIPNLFVMGAGASDIPQSELFMTEKWGQVIRWARSHFKIVLIDALSMGDFADFELMAPECDGILVVVRARSTNREALKTAIDQLDASKLIGVVWNGSNF